MALTRAVAVLGEQAKFRHVLRLAGLDEANAAEQITALSGARLIEDARPLTFVHPIVRNAIYRDMTTTERARAHRRAAQLLMEEHAPGELVAVQLLLSDANGDPAVVQALRGGAVSGEPGGMAGGGGVINHGAKVTAS